MKKLLALVLALTMAFALVACGNNNGGNAGNNGGTTGGDTTGGDTTGGEEMRITLITMDQMDVHWVKLAKAAQAKVDELAGQGKNIVYNWTAPEKKDNAQQIAMIEAAVNDGSDVIIIAVNDSTACNDALQEALNKGIKLIYVDATSTLEASATFATDNYAAGAEAGKAMLGYLSDKGLSEGTIGLVSAQAGVQSCIDRVDGFISAFEGTGYTLLETQFCEGDAAKAQTIAENYITEGVVGVYGCNEGSTTGAGNAIKASGKSIIDRVDGFVSAFEGSKFTMSEVQYSDGDAVKAQELTNALINDGVIGVYGANDGATNGAANAVKEANAGGKDILCVGFDNSSSNRAHVRDGELLAFMAQNPNVMGEKAIEAAVTLLEGGSLTETQVDTGVSVVTTENVDQFED